MSHCSSQSKICFLSTKALIPVIGVLFINLFVLPTEKMIKISSSVSCFLVLLIWGTLGGAAEKGIIFVSIVPQKYFVQQISKNIFNVEVMVKPGASPATYEPKPSQMTKLSSSLAYLAIGVPFEKVWLEKISAVNPEMKVVHTDAAIDKIAMAEHHPDEGGRDDVVDQHGKKHHGHGVLDPHIWLSPVLVKKQAKAILEALKSLLPEQASFFDANYLAFIKKIDGLDLELRQAFAGKKGMQFMVFHPSWGYFAKEYGLEQIAVEMEGKSPKPAQLQKLIHHARENKIEVIFVQPQFSRKNAKVVAREIGGKVITADPLAEDWFTNLRDVAAKFQVVVE